MNLYNYIQNAILSFLKPLGFSYDKKYKRFIKQDNTNIYWITMGKKSRHFLVIEYSCHLNNIEINKYINPIYSYMIEENGPLPYIYYHEIDFYNKYPILYEENIDQKTADNHIKVCLDIISNHYLPWWNTVSNINNIDEYSNKYYKDKPIKDEVGYFYAITSAYLNRNIKFEDILIFYCNKIEEWFYDPYYKDSTRSYFIRLQKLLKELGILSIYQHLFKFKLDEILELEARAFKEKQYLEKSNPVNPNEILVNGFDSKGPVQILKDPDNSLQVVFNTMPPIEFELDESDFDNFDKEMAEFLGVNVIWEDREVFLIEKPKEDTIEKLVDYLNTYKERKGYPREE